MAELEFYGMIYLVPSVLWRCWLGSRKGIRPVIDWVVGCWRGYLYLISCFSKIQTGFTILVPTHLGSPGKRAVKRVCVCGMIHLLKAVLVWITCNCFLTVTVVNLKKHTAVQARLHSQSTSYVPNSCKHCCRCSKNSFVICFCGFLYYFPNICSFASETVEIKIDNSFTRHPKLVSILYVSNSFTYVILEPKPVSISTDGSCT